MLKFKHKSYPALTVALMMGATLLSKLLGLLRTLAMSHNYGTGVEAQAFSEASHIPLTLFDIAFGAAILGCFIPVYNSFKEDAESADSFALTFLNVILLASSVLALLGILFADYVVALMAPGLDAEVRTLAAKLLRIMFPMVIFTGATFTLVGVMQSKGRYLLPAMISAVSNGGVVVYLLFIDSALGDMSIYGLAFAYLIAWLLQLLTLAIPLRASGFKLKPILDLKNPALKRSLEMVPPIMLGSWLTPVSVLSGLFFASLVDIDGAVTMFDYAYTVFALIAGVLTYSICNYAFPLLSKAVGEEWDRIVSTGLTAAAAIVLPFTGAAILLSRELVAVVCMRGEFTSYAAGETAYAMAFMMIGMPAFAVVEVCSRAFYSEDRVRIPMYAAIVGIAVNIALSAGLVNIGGLATGSVGLGYAAGITAAAAVMLVSLAKYNRGIFTRKFAINMLKLIISAALSTAVMAAIYIVLKPSPLESTWLKNILTCVTAFVPGAAVYLLCMKLLGIRINKV